MTERVNELRASARTRHHAVGVYTDHTERVMNDSMDVLGRPHSTLVLHGLINCWISCARIARVSIVSSDQDSKLRISTTMRFGSRECNATYNA